LFELRKPHIDRTAEMIRTILTRNSLRPADLQFILMVGGSTLIPCVRSRIGELLQIPVNCEIDPVTAVVVGAASFAGTRPKKLDGKAPAKPVNGRIKLRVAYNRTSPDNEELFSAKVEGNTDGLFYRITRQDGGFDTGLKQLSSRVSEDLPLLADTYNLFAFQVLDGQNNSIPTETTEIQIAQGKYSVAGQPLSHDICLVLDDLDNDGTQLRSLFSKGTVLQAKTSYTATVNTTVMKGSKDDVVRVIVPSRARHCTCARMSSRRRSRFHSLR
jgi:molecular chaperone DnaK